MIPLQENKRWEGVGGDGDATDLFLKGSCCSPPDGRPKVKISTETAACILGGFTSRPNRQLWDAFDEWCVPADLFIQD